MTFPALYKILLLLPLIGFYGCKKPEEKKNWTEVTVAAKNPLTGESLEDIYCKVIELKSGFGLSSSSTILSEGTTENGEFSFGFLAEKNAKYSYTFNAIADLYYKYYRIQFVEFAYLDKGEDHFYTMELIPYGFLSTRYNNVSCFDENDEIMVYRPNLDVPEYNGYSPQPFIGCNDATIAFVKIPMGRYAYEWHGTKDGTTEIFYDTLFLEAGDSVLYEINY